MNTSAESSAPMNTSLRRRRGAGTRHRRPGDLAARRRGPGRRAFPGASGRTVGVASRPCPVDAGRPRCRRGRSSPGTPQVGDHRRGDRAGADRQAPHEHGVRHRVAGDRIAAGDPQVTGGQHGLHVALAEGVLGPDQEVLPSRVRWQGGVGVGDVLAPLTPIQTWKVRRSCAEHVHLVLDHDPGVHAVGEDSGEDARRSGAVEVGPERRQDVVRAGGVGPRGQVAAVVVLGLAAADDEVTVGVDADLGPRPVRRTRTAERAEVDDLLVADGTG